MAPGANQTSTQKKEKPSPTGLGRAGFAALLITVCVVGSAAFGFGGTFLANYLSSSGFGMGLGSGVSPSDTDTGSDTTTTVLYQSVIRTSADNNAAGVMSLQDVVANVKDSVVEITTETVSTNWNMRQFISTGAGSGVIVSTDGYIVTNNHVVEGAQTIMVRLSNGQLYEAVLVGADAKTDIAVLKISATGLQPAILGFSSSLLVGQPVIAIGNPLGELGGTVTSGIISALDRDITIDGETLSLLQTDTAINPGNSGGGLFNLYGELVGIVNAKSSGSGIEGLGFAIPIDAVKDVIEQIIEFGYVKGRIDTGFILVDIQDNQTAMMYRINTFGLYISKSASSDFQSGDRITSLNGQTINSLADWNRQLDRYSVGDTIRVTVVRNGSSITYTLTLTELRN
ncbi:MAG: trypsin-like peptidase domain-containing protein [Coriobacteriia bacterium]|nr:trypsin-like peptidase domain-containing protein [Coriobacteriia bacterium]